MRGKKSSSFLISIVIILNFFVQGVFADTQSSIYPPPKEAKLNGKKFDIVDKSGKTLCGITCRETPSSQILAGIKKINQKIGKLSGNELPVFSFQNPKLKNCDTLIFIETFQDIDDSLRDYKKVFESMPNADQGYLIFTEKKDGQNIIHLLAQSDTGAMYACMTLCYLIDKNKNATILSDAWVKDWPDFKYRTLQNYAFLNGYRISFGFSGLTADLEKGSKTTKELIDELVRMKINMTSMNIGQPKADTVEDIFLNGAPLQKAWIKEMVSYAKQRGVNIFWGADTAIDQQFSNEVPRNDFCISINYSWRTCRFCWSSDELLKKAASKLADFINETGIDAVYLHPVDTYNQKWESRCEKCRTRFGNDQGAASGNVYEIYIEEIKKKNPSTIVFVIPRPYHGFDLDNNNWLKERLLTISKHVPKETYFVHTGMAEEADKSWGKYLGDNIFIWLNVGCFYDDGKQLSSDPQIFFIKTHFLNSRNICFFNAVANKMQQMWASNAMWNTDYPLSNKIIDGGKIYQIPNKENCETIQEVFNGKGDINIWQWTYKGKAVDWLDTYKEFSEDQEVRSSLSKLCSSLYGKKLGPDVANAVLSGYLPPYTDSPDSWKFRTGYINSYPKYNLESMREYNSKMEKAARPFEDALKNRTLTLPGEKDMQYEAYNTIFDIIEENAKSNLWVILLERKEKKISETELNSSFDDGIKKLDSILEFYKGFPEDTRAATKVNRRTARLTEWLEHIKMLDQSARVENNSKYPRPELTVKNNSPIRIAVYNPNSNGGSACGFQALYNTLKGIPGTEVSYIDRISKDAIKNVDCIYIPQINKLGKNEKKAEFFNELREFCKTGGNVYMQHDSIGYSRFALGCPVFSEISNSIIMENANSYYAATEHPLTKGSLLGKILNHMYMDRFVMKNLKNAEAVLVNKKGEAVVAAAYWGKGKIILDGTITFGEKSECEKAEKFNELLLINSVGWFRSGKAENFIIENPSICISQKTEPDAVHYYLQLNPKIISKNEFTQNTLSIGISDKNGKEIFSQNISIKSTGKIWQAEEQKLVLDLPADPAGKILVMKILDNAGAEILSKKYIIMH